MRVEIETEKVSGKRKWIDLGGARTGAIRFRAMCNRNPISRLVKDPGGTILEAVLDPPGATVG